ncbi:MAG: gamma-glutamyl-gamma-aminobutyrate hydrolase family protein [Gammaproteobacteria bacterium]
MRKRKILVFQHVPFEPLGTLDPQLRNAGFRIRYVNFARDPHQRPSLEGYSGLVILGGPMNADDVENYPNLATEVELIKEALQRGMQILGICLGSQLLAKALGGRVLVGKTKEIGWYPVTPTTAGRVDPLMSCFEESEVLFQWHGDHVELPYGAKWLAESTICPVQAYAYGGTAYGFQFHLEVDEPLIERWLTVPCNVDELASVADYIDPMDIRHHIRTHLPRMQDLSHDVFGRWIEQFSLPQKMVLGSR